MRWTKTRLSIAASASFILLVVMGILFPRWLVGSRAPPPRVSSYIVEYPHDYRFIVDEPGTCQRRKPFAVLIVPVHPRNRADRDVIRRTWGSETRGPVSGQTVSLLFLLGMPTGEEAERVQRDVLEESREHRDLLQADFVDAYRNLTVKTMVMMEWLDSRCPNASYAMKVDSDTFVNVSNLVDMLLKAPKVNYLTGLILDPRPVDRDPNSKFYLPVEVFPETLYPTYPQGLGYILSLDLPRKLVEASRHVKASFIEDVYVGSCMRHLGIPHTRPPHKSQFVFGVPYSRCAYSKLIVTLTDRDVVHRMNSWEDFKRSGPYCPVVHKLWCVHPLWCASAF